MADLPWRAIHVVFTIVMSLASGYIALARARKAEVDALKERAALDRKEVDLALKAISDEQHLREKAHALEKDALKERIGILERGYSKHNERLQHIPTMREMNEQTALLRAVDAKLGAFDKRLERIEDYTLSARAS